MEKKLILVTSPPACGKTYVAKALAKNLKHVVYLDKDTLIVLSKQIFKVAGQPYDRSSAFFQQNIRDYEYDCVLALAMEALDYDDIVLINAPFTQEVRDNAFIEPEGQAGRQGRDAGRHLGRNLARGRPPANDRAQLGPRHLEAGSLG